MNQLTEHAVDTGPKVAPAPPRPAFRLAGRRAVSIAVAALALAMAIVATFRLRTPAPPQYLTAPADRGTVARAVTSSGAVNPVTTIQVGSYVSGVIQTILCDFNTRVKAGQLCAKIDPRPYQSTVAQEAAALGTARAQLEKDRANLRYTRLIDARNAGLLTRGIVSQETVDTAHSAFEQATAQVALAQATVAQHAASLQAARINLGYTDIASPVDGTVVSRNVTQGQTVAASFQTPTLFLIATDLTNMQVDTNVSESDIGRIAPGDHAVFTVAAFPERQFAGVVTQVRQSPQTVQNVVTYDVVVGVDNRDLALKPGMTASVRIVTDQADNVLRVPGQALRYRPAAPDSAAAQASAGREQPGIRSGMQVWILTADGPHPVAVTPGLEDDTHTQIVVGALRAGDQVILSQRAGATPRESQRTTSLPGVGVPAR